MYIKIHI